MKLESPLGSDLARLVRIWRALIDHRLKPLELTQTHWVTLHNIHQLPPDQSQIQLAKAIGIEQPPRCVPLTSWKRRDSSPDKPAPATVAPSGSN